MGGATVALFGEMGVEMDGVHVIIIDLLDRQCTSIWALHAGDRQFDEPKHIDIIRFWNALSPTERRVRLFIMQNSIEAVRRVRALARPDQPHLLWAWGNLMRIHVMHLLQFDPDVEYEVLYSAHMEAITRFWRGLSTENVERSDQTLVRIAVDLGASNPQAPIAAARNAAGPALMEAYRAMVRANGRRVAAVRGAELVAILGGDPETLSEDELRSVYMSSLGAAAHGSVQARAEALDVTTTEYFLAGGAAGVHGLNTLEIRARAHDVLRRGGLSAAAATAGGADLVDILGGDADDFSDSELRSIHMGSLGAAARASAAAKNRGLGGATKVSAPSLTLLIANCESIVTPDSTDKVTNRLYAVSRQ